MNATLLEPETIATRQTPFVRLFEQSIDRFGDSIAIEFEGTTWTYDEVNRKANKIARFLLPLRSSR
jgi:acyl-CoA synthetase (AMP-forming)/AMP-acid ligase II